MSFPENTVAAVAAPLQTTWSVGSMRPGVGLMVKIKPCETPEHVSPFTVEFGVTTTCAFNGESDGLMAVNGLILPLPEAAKPIPGVLFVQV